MASDGVAITLDRHSVSVTITRMMMANNLILAIVQDSLIDALCEIGDMSQAQVPRASGALAASMYLSEPEIGPLGISVGIGYGGPNDTMNPITGKMTSSYMVPVHERLDVNHPVGKAKFLEDPLLSFASVAGERLATRIRLFTG